ncbi:MAG: TetR/AcrR family transcriptional regulator [Candidatus Korobacteraceae bacterium]
MTSHRPNLLKFEQLPPEPRQRRSQEKRKRLKDAALQLFRSRGYERTSVEQITKRANLATGSFYQHYRSKQQLLLALMDELLAAMGQLSLRPNYSGDVRASLRELLARGFANDLRYLGAYRAWEEAVLSDPQMASGQITIRRWTTKRVAVLLTSLQQWPGARPGVDVPALAQVIDTLFWSLLAQAVFLTRVELNDWIDAATHLIHHTLFLDPSRGDTLQLTGDSKH